MIRIEIDTQLNKVSCKDILAFKVGDIASFKLVVTGNCEDIMLKVINPLGIVYELKPTLIIDGTNKHIYQVSLDKDDVAITGKYRFKVVIDDETIMSSMYQIVA